MVYNTMNHVKLFLCLEVIACVVSGIKVNMQGSLNLGKDVVESISHYLGHDFVSARRSLNPPPIEDPVTLAVRTALICKDLEFCQGELQHFLNEYIIILAKAVANILSGSNTEFNNQEYEEQLKQSLDHFRQILEDANSKIEKENEVYYWTLVIKRINAKFQNMADGISDTNNVANLGNSTHKAMDLLHKIVIAVAFIERKYQIKLCSEHNICSKSHECTKALNKLLIHFKTLPEDRIRMFVKYFYEALFDSDFYRHLSIETANEFQIILNDMSYANDTPTKDIMLSVLKTVEARIEMIQLNKGLVVAHEILVAHTILSDVDYMFYNHTNTFTKFMNKFYDWLASDIQLEKHVRTVLSDIAKQILTAEDDLVHKLIKEVKVFLEMALNVEK